MFIVTKNGRTTTTDKHGNTWIRATRPNDVCVSNKDHQRLQTLEVAAQRMCDAIEKELRISGWLGPRRLDAIRSTLLNHLPQE